MVPADGRDDGGVAAPSAGPCPLEAPTAAQKLFETAGLPVQTFTVWVENRGLELLPLR